MKKFTLITVLILALSPKISAIDVNLKNNSVEKENSEIIFEKFEEIDVIKILENYKKHELINNIIKILDSFPTAIYDEISAKDIDDVSITSLFAMPGKFFCELTNSQTYIVGEQKKYAFSMLKIMAYIKENTSPEILSRIKIDIFEDDSANKFISKDDHLYTLTGITIPLILKYFQNFYFNDGYSNPQFKFNLKAKTLNWNFTWNSKNLFASFIINNDESLTMKFGNNNKIFLKFTLEKY